MRSHVTADLGGVRAPALNEFAGLVLRAWLRAFGLGVTKKQKSAHDHAMDIDGGGRHFSMSSPAAECRSANG